MSHIKKTQLPHPQRAPVRKPRGFFPSALALALSGALAVPGTAFANSWTGAVDNNWFTQGNWINLNQVPTAADTAVINVTTGQVVLVGSGSAAALNVFLGSTAGNAGALTIANGSSLTANSTFLGAFFTDASGTLIVDGNNTVFTSSTGFVVGNDGTGTFTVSGGATANTNSGALGFNLGAHGDALVTGGSVWNSGTGVAVGDQGTGTMLISNGGTVQGTGGNLGFSAGGSGTVTVDTGGTWDMTGVLRVGNNGQGKLNVTNGGIVNSGSAIISSAANTNSTVLVDGTNSLWANSGNLNIGTAAGTGTPTLTIANSGAVTATALIFSGGAASTGTINIGGAAGATATGPGTLLAPGGVSFGASTGAINFNHTDTSGNYVFGANISGTAGKGAINQNAGWTNLTGNSGGFSGPTTVNGGRLAVNGSLANSNVTVNNTGILGGNGIVGNTAVNTGGTVAPGNSIGTLNVNGNVTFAAGSTYQVETSPTLQSDKLLVSGTATLNGGTVQVIGGTGNYNPTTNYAILTAQSGVTGTFAGVSDDLVYQDASLSYSANDVTLTLTRNSTPMGSVGQTPGQSNTGTGVQGLGAGSAVYNAVLGLSAPQARNAFQQLSGEVHASARGVLVQDSHFARDASLERLRALDSEVVANDGGADPEEGKPARLLPSVRDLAYWARAMGSWGHIDGDAGSASVKRDTSGFLMGADTRFGEEGRFGLMGGYSRSAFDVSDRASSGSSDNYHLGAYAGSRWGDLALRTGLNYSWHDVSTSRVVAFPGFTDSLKGDYKASTTQAFVELGYRIKTERADLEPFANLVHVNVSSDGFTERGGAAALTSAGNSSGVTFATLGLRASTNFTMSNGTSVTARGSLGWRGASGDITPVSSLAFASGTPFAITGAPVAKSAAVVEAGLDFKLTNAATLGLSYGGQFGSGLKDHSARIHFNLAF